MEKATISEKVRTSKCDSSSIFVKEVAEEGRKELKTKEVDTVC
jgi:hypothetical protein